MDSASKLTQQHPGDDGFGQKLAEKEVESNARDREKLISELNNDISQDEKERSEKLLDRRDDVLAKMRTTVLADISTQMKEFTERIDKNYKSASY
ncbi:hypothetical protein [Dyadobacter sp. NIV53]|uniref:hypothetical protein n=1 Tax=Dyadobacter sp. NIV53 TaxID=2861765 RepID=UPI001C88D53D|nr:hypothetical protein [Dyadobacter sp. NIV53]